MTIKEVSEKYNISQDTLRYYERAGMIPPVTRTKGGIRNYGEQDLKWLEMALCMRNAGLPVEAMAEYLRLFQLGDETIPERLALLTSQRDILLAKKQEIDNTLKRLNYKISIYEKAAEKGTLVFDRGSCKKETEQEQ